MLQLLIKACICALAFILSTVLFALGVVLLPPFVIDFLVLFLIESFLALVSILFVIRNELLHFEVTIRATVLIQLLLLHSVLILILLELSHLLLVHLLPPLHSEISVAVSGRWQVLCVLILLLLEVIFVLIAWFTIVNLMLVFSLTLPVKVQGLLLARVLPIHVVDLNLSFLILALFFIFLLIFILFIIILLIWKPCLLPHIELVQLLHQLGVHDLLVYKLTHCFSVIIKLLFEFPFKNCEKVN